MTATLSAGDEPAPATRSRWLVLAGLWLVYFSFGLTVASMAPLVGPISAELQMSNGRMGAIFGAWPLTYIIAAIPCGMLLDRLGARRMLFLAALIMAASSVARGFAQSPTHLLLAVALFGIGGPMISVGAPTLVARLFQGKDRGTAMGIYITGPYLGGLIALALTNSVSLPLAGGDWRGVMFLNGGFVALSGLVWLVIASGLAPRRQQGDAPAKKFNLSAFGEILRLREVRLILLMSVCIFFINHALNNWLPEILRAKGFTPVDAGYWAAIPSSVGILSGLLIPRLATPERRLPVMILLFAAAMLATVLLQFQAGALLAPGLVLQGLARGAMMTVAVLVLMETPNLPQKSLGLAGGLFFTTAEIGGVLGPVVFGVLSDLSGGFTLSLCALTVVCAGLFGLLWRYARARAEAAGGQGPQ
ncbi:MFS transporter [Oceanibium sediminis]|uniref:MFS transporter n=1 Tax=Oceanibium sediminis TaxID=2026339 RepID=UPI0013004095|nr:MFS transporter [Oceanibium sediminis]